MAVPEADIPVLKREAEKNLFFTHRSSASSEKTQMHRAQK
jgi:hypothetical protein